MRDDPHELQAGAPWCAGSIPWDCQLGL